MVLATKIRPALFKLITKKPIILSNWFCFVVSGEGFTGNKKLSLYDAYFIFVFAILAGIINNKCN